MPFHAVRESGAVQRFIRPAPHTNGKIERFNRTLLEDGPTFAPTSQTNTNQALTDWLQLYNHHRAHTSLGGHPPISRLNNMSGHYTSQVVPVQLDPSP